MAEARLPTECGEFRCVAYQSVLDHETHLAFVMGEPAGEENVLVRVHSECLTGRRVRVAALRLRRPAARGHGA